MYLIIESGIIPQVSERPEIFKFLFIDKVELLGVLKFSFFDVFFNYSPETSLIPPLWTMPFEFLGSVVILVLCALFGKNKHRLKIYFLLFWIIYAFHFYYLSSFVAGMIFADLYQLKKIKPTFRIPFGSFLIASILAIALPGGSQKLYLAVSLLMFYGLIYCQPITEFLQNKISVFFGTISFTLYLFHSLIIWSFALPMAAFLKNNGLLSNSFLWLIDLFTILISILGARFFVNVDRFSVTFSHKFADILIRMRR